MIQKIILGVLSIITIGLLVFISVQPSDKYVNLQQIYSEFEYQISVNKTLEQYKVVKTHELDSLKSNFEEFYIANQGQQELLQTKQMELQKYMSQVSQEVEQMELNIESTIWSHINDAVKDYGSKHKLSYVFGISGNGVLMYADTTNNVSKEIITILNNKHYE